MTHVQSTPLPRSRAIFWPVALLLIGAVWLLSNLRIFSVEHLGAALMLAPLLLVAAGLDLIFGYRLGSRRALLVPVLVVVYLLAVLVLPTLGLISVPEMRSSTYSTAVEGAESYSLEIGMGINDLRIAPLSDSNQLVSADLRYYGEIEYSASGTTERVVRLGEQLPNSISTFPFLYDLVNERHDWRIGLNPTLPLTLTVSGGMGGNTLDLAALNLRSVTVSGMMGGTTLNLAAPQQSYEVVISGTMGGTTINLPAGAAVRLELSGAMGGQEIGGGLVAVSGQDNAWETPSYASAAAQIRIIYSGGMGGLTVR